MEIIKTYTRRNKIMGRNITTVSLIRLDDGLRLVYEFLYADPGFLHDAGSSVSLFGNGTRLKNIADAVVIPDEYAEIRFSDARAAI